MHAAAVEQYLKTIQELQRKTDGEVAPAAIAQRAGVTEEQVQEVIERLVERGMVELESPNAVRLTPYGLRWLLTESVEDYLVTIYRLNAGQQDERVTTSAIAKALGVSAPSVTSMIQKKLHVLNLVDYERHRGVVLTPLGERIALQILRNHRIVESYLAETLGLPWDQVHEEAHRLEHVMSPTLVDRMATSLGDPLVDPHGDPIPRKDGTMVHAGLISLYEAEVGQTVIVRRIGDQSPDVLRYLAEIGLIPGTQVQVLARAPLQGPLTVRIKDAEQVLGRDLAHTIWVSLST